MGNRGAFVPAPAKHGCCSLAQVEGKHSALELCNASDVVSLSSCRQPSAVTKPAFLMQEAMPEHLQIQELVKAATEPRVAALGVELLAQGGEELRKGKADASRMSQADAVRNSLSLFKVCCLSCFTIAEIIQFASPRPDDRGSPCQKTSIHSVSV